MIFTKNKILYVLLYLKESFNKDEAGFKRNKISLVTPLKEKIPKYTSDGPINLFPLVKFQQPSIRRLLRYHRYSRLKRQNSPAQAFTRQLVRIKQSQFLTCLHLLKIGIIPKKKCSNLKKPNFLQAAHLIKHSLFYFKMV